MKKAIDNFQIFVKPVGAACNLACQYCYYLEKDNLYPENSNSVMPEDLLENYIVQHIEATSGTELFFSWHGGEPTLAGLNYFRRIVELQQKHKPKNSRITNGLQTNGSLLDDEWCRFLAEEKFVVGISFDGPEEFHSIYRNSKNGKSTFETTVRAFRLLKAYGIACEILCVVHAKNAGHPLRVYNFFKELNADFVTFIPLVEKNASGKVTERSTPAKAFGEFLCAIFDEWKTFDIGKLKIQIFEETIRSAFDLEHSLCILKKTCGRVPILEHNGDFYSCDHFVSPEYRVGNIRETPLVELLESRQQKAFGESKYTLLPNYCLNCEVLPMCHGACPKDRLIFTPEGEPGLNYLCEGYKLFFGHSKPFVEAVAKVWKSE